MSKIVFFVVYLCTSCLHPTTAFVLPTILFVRMGSSIGMPSRSASKMPSSPKRILFQYVNETQVYSFYQDPSEILSANLTGIVEQHIFSQQESARTSCDATDSRFKATEPSKFIFKQLKPSKIALNLKTRDPTQLSFPNLDLAAWDDEGECQNPFQGNSPVSINKQP